MARLIATLRYLVVGTETGVDQAKPAQIIRCYPLPSFASYWSVLLTRAAQRMMLAEIRLSFAV